MGAEAGDATTGPPAATSVGAMDAALPADAIQRAFAAVHGAGPAHRARPADGVVEGIEAYALADGGGWHLVTHGLADGPAGLGQELTLLVPPAATPQPWAFELLAGVARTLRAAARGLHPGARLAPGEPLDGRSTGLVALGVREDPLVVVPGLALLQVVGVTAGEHAVMGKVGTALVLEKLSGRDPLLRTDPARA